MNARVETLPGFSAHADRKGLLNWLEHVEGLNRAFIVHGEESQSLAFADLVRSSLGIHADVPNSGDTVELGPDGSVSWVSGVERPVDERIRTVATLLDQLEARARVAKTLLADAPSSRLDRLETALRDALAALDHR